MLQDDGIELIKIFLAITKDEQLRRFEDRLKDPYKQWKLSKDDLKARRKWTDYVKAVDQMLKETNSESSCWHMIPANHKPSARREVLKCAIQKLKPSETWMENQATQFEKCSIDDALEKLDKDS